MGKFNWETLKNLIESFGWVKGVFAIFFFLAHFAYDRMVRGRLKDRQKEIDRLAEDNRRYREIYLKGKDD